MALHEKNILLGGPTSDRDDSEPNGMVLLLDLPDRESVTRFLDDDPYCMAGLFTDRIVTVWNPVQISLTALTALASLQVS